MSLTNTELPTEWGPRRFSVRDHTSVESVFTFVGSEFVLFANSCISLMSIYRVGKVPGTLLVQGNNAVNWIEHS